MKSRSFSWPITLLAGALFFSKTTHGVRADDGIFPAAPAARKFIDFDNRGFMINGHRTFIASGSLHYSRVPRALWRDRLLKYQRMGINCVETYTFWNVHEPKRGQFNFSGDADLGAFLSLAQSLGMYAILRVGPYYCAEWDSGGYPIWLRNTNAQVRSDDPEFKKAVSDYFDHLLPIVSAHQISRGGNVVLVQLENEHLQGSGTEMPNGYFTFLRDKFLAAGGEVPYFFSGLHHSGDPAGDHAWDSKGRRNPWIVTEFWPGQFSEYGVMSPASQRKYDRGTWKILAYGGNGYSYYMLHGGTNFDYFNDQTVAASYDYTAAIGQAGDLRPIYYRFKRAAMFATSFAPVLENSENADADYQNVASSRNLKITARRSPSGTLAFLDNPGDEPLQTQITAPDGTQSGPIKIEAGEIMPIVRDFPLASGVEIDWAPTRVLGISKQDNLTTLVVYGQVGMPAEVRFSIVGQLQTPNANLLSKSGTNWTFKTQFAAMPVEANFSVGTQRVRVLALSPEMADRTWFVGAGKRNVVISGPNFVGDVTAKSGSYQIGTARPWNGATAFPTFVYDTSTRVVPVASYRTNRPAPLPLSNWQSASATDEAAPDYNDSTWLQSTDAPQIGSDNDVTFYAWYRTHLKVPTSGTYTMTLGTGGGKKVPFVDGQALPVGAVNGATLTMNLSAGTHTLAVFASHEGHDKYFGYMGKLGGLDVKGLSGKIYFGQMKGGTGVLDGWKMRPADANALNAVPSTTQAGWRDYKIGEDAFGGKEGYAWFTATLPALTSSDEKTLHFVSVDEDATVYLNGVKVGEHRGWNQSFDVALDKGWIDGGTNQLMILIRNQSNPGGIDKPVTLISFPADSQQTGWKLRGGPKAEGKNLDWKPLTSSATLPANGPRWYAATFQNVNAAPSLPMWRLKTHGMSMGSAWLNGHNLGRYPEKIPVDGLYLPENWLNAGTNRIEIYDEEGKSPSGVVIEVEKAASRDTQNLVALRR